MDNKGKNLTNFFGVTKEEWENFMQWHTENDLFSYTFGELIDNFQTWKEKTKNSEQNKIKNFLTFDKKDKNGKIISTEIISFEIPENTSTEQLEEILKEIAKDAHAEVKENIKIYDGILDPNEYKYSDILVNNYKDNFVGLLSEKYKILSIENEEKE